MIINIPQIQVVTLTLAITIMTGAQSFCQVTQNIEKGRISTADGQQIEFQNLSLNEGSYRFENKKSRSDQSVPEDQVLRIERQTGNEALMWGGALGGAALVGSLLGVKRAESTSGFEADSESKTAIVAGLTGLGVAIGILVGSKQKKYETVYSNTEYQPKSRWGLDFQWQPYSTGLALSYKF